MWHLFFVTFYVLYAIAAIRYLNHYIYKKIKFTQCVDPELPEKWKPFVRYDRNQWRILEIYLGALFLLPIRLFLLLGLLFLLAIVLIVGGVEYEKQWPKYQYQCVRKAACHIGSAFMFAAGFYRIPIKKLCYTEYDPTYVQETADSGNKDPCIMISNHVSWFDQFYLAKQYLPSFLAKDQVRDMLIIGWFAKRFQGIFVDRTSRESKQAVMNQIKTRVAQITNKEDFPPILIFPEGTTTNGKYLLTFRRGAFDTLAPVQIICLRYHDRYFNLSNDSIGITGAFLALTQFYNKLESYEFKGVYNPPFLQDQTIPHEERCQRYAEAARDIMTKCLGVQKSESSLVDYWDYEKHIFMKNKSE